jgi:pyruvate/2-oxoglutarate dehydrogenase complex dihydrolipoamide dehydrogenase (E3) component
MSDNPRTFDAVIVGSGQGGNPLAVSLANAGWKVALVERKAVGGTCVNEGCTPTKAMISSARVAYLTRKAEQYGVKAGPSEVDLSSVVRRKDEIVESFKKGSKERLLSTEGITLIEGDASFADKKLMRIKTPNGEHELVTAQTIVLDTGTSPATPSIPGLENVHSLDSSSIMEMKEIPEHLLVIGGGYIGLEFGQMFRRFGSRVTIMQRNDQLLPREDKDIAEEIEKIFRDEGIDILLDSQPLRIEPHKDIGISLEVKTPQEHRTISGNHLLVAVGRVPNTRDLNLNLAGVSVDSRGFVQVNERLETTSPGVYAIGDVKGGPAFTHISYDDFRILKRNLVDGGDVTVSGRLVPYVVFIDPQLGRVGITEREARDQNLEYKVAKIPMKWVARAIETGETRGVMKVLVDSDTDKILGAAILGLEGGEVMTALQLAILAGMSYKDIRDGIFAHPTLSESLNSLFMVLDE